AADANAGEDEVGRRDRLRRRFAEPHASAPALGARHLLGDWADDRQARSIHVVQRDLVNREIGGGEARDEQRSPDAGAANDGDFHAGAGVRVRADRIDGGSLVGSAAIPPAAGVARAPPMLPARRHPYGVAPRRNANRIPPSNASPAPVVSIARTRAAAARMSTDGAIH